MGPMLRPIIYYFKRVFAREKWENWMAFTAVKLPDPGHAGDWAPP